MSEAARELGNRFYALASDGEGRLLVVDGSLPSWETTGRLRWSDAGQVTAALRERFGFDAFVLRPLLGGRDDAGRGVWAYELEARSTPRHGRWIDGNGVGTLPDAEQRSIAAAALDGGARDEALRAPWSWPGWYDGVLPWIDERLEELGRRRVGEPNQTHAWAISSVLRIPTIAGDVYFKAVPPHFGHEAALTSALARRHRGRITTVLAADEERRWMLMEDIGGAELRASTDASTWEHAVSEYARIQVDWVDDVDELLALGCPDRRLEVLEGEIDEALADPLLVELPRGLSSDETERLPALAERLHDACALLGEHDLPPTLEHGDLHPGNVRLTDDGPVFFDWTDGAVSVPFFTLGQLLDWDTEPPQRERVRAAYRAVWVTRLDERRLDDALALAEVVGLYHLATSYRRIARTTEPAQRWELGPVFPLFVRKLLTAAGER